MTASSKLYIFSGVNVCLLLSPLVQCPSSKGAKGALTDLDSGSIDKIPEKLDWGASWPWAYPTC